MFSEVWEIEVSCQVDREEDSCCAEIGLFSDLSIFIPTFSVLAVNMEDAQSNVIQVSKEEDAKIYDFVPSLILSLSTLSGPCSKCAVTISKPCFCGKTIVPVRCSQLEASSSSGISCSQTCSKPLNCSLHSCTLPCHDGPCDPCEKTTVARCYCGNDEKELLCGEGEAKISRKKIQVQDNVSDSSIEEWQGRFDCQKDCGREFKCGKHSCQKSCHSQDLEEIDCPRDPKFHPRCPCGATSTEHRGSCSDPIPTCSNTCGKVLACGHSCSTQCHLGEFTSAKKEMDETRNSFSTTLLSLSSLFR